MNIPALILRQLCGFGSLKNRAEGIVFELTNRLSDSVAGTGLAGEISLASAISSLDWVSSHEPYGRNR